ncbi:MAG: GNAT family N-acetyltransferase [Acidiferrobacterales bacterium]
MTLQDITVRLGQEHDSGALVEFNVAMARETESKVLSVEVVAAGVRSLLKNPQYGFYVVAEKSGMIAGSLMVTPEWSDWRNGEFWWIQSVYVTPAHRRQGVYRRLYEYVRARATEKGNVCGFRLYVEEDNLIAQSTYRNLGMGETPYKLLEELVVLS